MRAMLMAAIGLACSLCVMISVGYGSDYPIEPHPATQQLLAKWMETANRAEIDEHYTLLARLQPLAIEDYRRFVEQVIYFVDQMEQEEKVRASGVRALLVFCMVPEGEIAAAVSPYLYSQHASLRKEAWKLFPAVLGSGLPEASADLSHIRDHVTGNRQQPEISTPLKRAIFELAPKEAFRLFVGEAGRIDGFKLTRARHQIDNAIFERNLILVERGYLTHAKERGLPDGKLPVPAPWTLDDVTIAALRKLATSKHWWARMFAAEMMVQNKDLRVADLLKELGEDENDLVRQSISSIETPDALRATPVAK